MLMFTRGTRELKDKRRPCQQNVIWHANAVGFVKVLHGFSYLPLLVRRYFFFVLVPAGNKDFNMHGEIEGRYE